MEEWKGRSCNQKAICTVRLACQDTRESLWGALEGPFDTVTMSALRIVALENRTVLACIYFNTWVNKMDHNLNFIH